MNTLIDIVIALFMLSVLLVIGFVMYVTICYRDYLYYGYDTKKLILDILLGREFEDEE